MHDDIDKTTVEPVGTLRKFTYNKQSYKINNKTNDKIKIEKSLSLSISTPFKVRLWLLPQPA